MERESGRGENSWEQQCFQQSPQQREGAVWGAMGSRGRVLCVYGEHQAHLRWLWKQLAQNTRSMRVRAGAAQPAHLLCAPSAPCSAPGPVALRWVQGSPGAAPCCGAEPPAPGFPHPRAAAVSVPPDNLIPFRLGESLQIPPRGEQAAPRGVVCNEFQSFQHKGSLQERLLQKILGSLPYHPSETSVVAQ